MVDLDALSKNNMLIVKYVKNRNILRKIPKRKVSKGVADIIYKLCSTGEFNDKEFYDLSKTDQEIVANFINNCHIDVGFDFTTTDEDEFDKQYNILVGQMNCGNPSVANKRKFVDLVLMGISTKKIPLQQGLLDIEKII